MIKCTECEGFHCEECDIDLDEECLKCKEDDCSKCFGARLADGFGMLNSYEDEKD